MTASLARSAVVEAGEAVAAGATDAVVSAGTASSARGLIVSDLVLPYFYRQANVREDVLILCSDLVALRVLCIRYNGMVSFRGIP